VQRLVNPGTRHVGVASYLILRVRCQTPIIIKQMAEKAYSPVHAQRFLECDRPAHVMQGNEHRERARISEETPAHRRVAGHTGKHTLGQGPAMEVGEGREVGY